MSGTDSAKLGQALQQYSTVLHKISPTCTACFLSCYWTVRSSRVSTTSVLFSVNSPIPSSFHWPGTSQMLHKYLFIKFLTSCRNLNKSPPFLEPQFLHLSIHGSEIALIGQESNHVMTSILQEEWADRKLKRRQHPREDRARGFAVASTLPHFPQPQFQEKTSEICRVCLRSQDPKGNDWIGNQETVLGLLLLIPSVTLEKVSKGLRFPNL